ncbi:MAG TPA: DUF938 domain-containing protein [Steroidobacteraceae bacterium]|nr:DUF938 domain-containing protein [Steroidobacteraceae bacterium]
MDSSAPSSPAAERNKGPILEVLRTLMPDGSAVLEIASGTGQHVVHFAAEMPLSSWQPSDPDAENLAAIRARLQLTKPRNVQPPVQLDVHHQVWSVPSAFDAVLCINMIHIAPWSATLALLAGARRALRAGGPRLLLLYGPYKEGGQHTAPSNEAFDAQLIARHPRWGVRDLEEVTSAALAQGFQRQDVVRMPANNLVVVFRG